MKNKNIELAGNIYLPELETKYGNKNISKTISFMVIILVIIIVTGLIIASICRIDLVIDANGILEPEIVQHIHSPEAGRISTIFVKSGDSVKKGDRIIELDSLSLFRQLEELQSKLNMKNIELNKKRSVIPYEKYQNNLQIEKLEASILRSKANLRNKLDDYYPGKNVDSILNSYIKGSHIAIDIPLSDLITAEAEYKIKKSQNDMYDIGLFDIKNMEIERKQIEDQINEIKYKLRENKLVSPLDGTILTEGIDQLNGTYVSEGSLILDISPMKSWNAILFVGEKDIHRIKIGDPVKIEITALKTSTDYKIYHGKIISIAEEKNSKERYPNYVGLYRLSVAMEESGISNIGNEGVKKGYSIVGKIITVNDTIIKLIFNHFSELF
jgi:multidrug resistance efflux pump